MELSSGQQKQRSISKSILGVNEYAHVFISHAHNIRFVCTNEMSIIHDVNDVLDFQPT